MTDVAELGFAIDRKAELAKGKKGLDDLTRASMGAERAARLVVSSFRTMVAQVASVYAFKQMISGALRLSGALAEVSTLLPEVGTNIKQIEAAAHDMARTFGTTATDQVKAFYQVFSAGASSVTEATNILTAANKLAVGGVTDIKTAADGLTSVLNAYGDQVKGTTAVSDAMFVAMRAGKTTIGELSASLGKVAPIAATLKIPFEELVAAVAALTKGGISTRESVTGVRAILAAIAKPTSEAAKLSKALGLEFNSTALQSKGLTGFLEDVVKKTGGSNDALAQLFGGVEALIPVMALAGQAGQDFTDIMEQMGQKAGSTDEAFLRIAQNAEFKTQRAFSKIADVAVIVGNKLTEITVPAIESVADAVSDPNFIRGAVAFGNAIIQVINAIAQVAGGALAALGDLYNLVNKTGALQHAGQVLGPISDRPIEMLRQQLADKEPLLSGDRWLWDRAGLEKEVEALKQEIARRLDPTAFDVGGVFKSLPGNDNGKTYGSVDEAIAALKGEAVRTGSGGGVAPIVNIDEILASLSGSGDAAENAADKYAKLIMTAQQRIGQAQIEASVLGMTTEAANRLRIEQELLNSAANDNISLTAAQRSELEGLAGQIAASEEATRRLTEAYDLGRDITRGFFSDMRSGLIEGKDLWQTFGNAALNVLDRLAQKATETFADNIWNSIFGGLGGGFNPLGFLFGGGRASGGPVQAGVAYRVNENTPNSEYFVPGTSGTIVPSNNNSGGKVEIDISFSVDGSGNIVPMVRQIAGQEANVRVAPVARAVGQMAKQSNSARYGNG